MDFAQIADKNRPLRYARWHASSTRKAPTLPDEGPIGHLRIMQNDQLGFVLRAREACGDVARFRFILLPAHLLAHPDHVRHILVDNHRTYDKQTKGFDVLRLVLGNGLLTSEGDFWKRQRRIAQPAFHRDRIGAFADVMVAAAEDTVRRLALASKTSSVVDIAAEMMRLTLRIAGETLLSTDVSKDADDVGSAVSRLLKEANARILRPISLPLSIPTPHNVRIKQCLDSLNNIVHRMIEERRHQTQRPNDLLTMLMDARDEETGEGMTDKQLRDEVLTIFLAGHETTANALSWTFYLLSKHPEAARKIIAELQSVLGGRSPTLADANKLVYTTAVLKEAMRLYPPAWIIGRRAVMDDVIDGFEIPRDSFVFVSPWVTHRHPTFWPNPEGFDPERFMPGKVEDIPRFAYFPFGAGPRLCIGQGFAMLEAQLLLATICQKVQLDLVPGHAVIPQPSITLRPRTGILAPPSLMSATYKTLLAVCAAFFIGRDAAAFPHVVTPGETLASIAERTYGKVEMERLLVSANALDASGGIAIVPGMRLEIPANSYHRVSAGETWASLATHYLGNPERADVLAISNDAMPWIEPVLGQELRIPYNLRHVANSNDSTLAIAYKYTSDRDKAWMIDKYNKLKGRAIRRGDVILVPLWELALTEAGKNEAAESFVVSRSEGGGRGRDAQKRADAEVVLLFSDVRQGRYVDAVARGNRILGLGDLTKPQIATANRLLTEAYVALDARGPAEAACNAWRDADPDVILDPILLSPKILRVCTEATSATKTSREGPPSTGRGPNVDAGIDSGTRGDAGSFDKKGTRP